MVRNGNIKKKIMTPLERGMGTGYRTRNATFVNMNKRTEPLRPEGSFEFVRPNRNESNI